jgi:8-oxo-dGTP diphosphatase
MAADNIQVTPHAARRMIRVVAALIWRQGDVFVQQRRSHGPHAGLWEFPGGKVESGEADVTALCREAAEELAVDLRVGAQVYTTQYADVGVDIDLRVYSADIVGMQAPSCLAAQRQCWLPVGQLHTLPFCPADAGLIAALQAGRLRPPVAA